MADDFKPLPKADPCASGEDKQEFMDRLAKSEKLTPHWMYDKGGQLVLYIKGQFRCCIGFLASEGDILAGAYHIAEAEWGTPQILWAYINAMNDVRSTTKRTIPMMWE